MKRGATAATLLACAVAGVVAALLLVATPVAGADDGTTTSTGTTTVTTPETTPTVTTPAPPAPGQPRVIAAGITVGGTLVGGLSSSEAQTVVKSAFGKPLQLVVSPTRSITVDPRELGAAAYVGSAVKRALSYHREGLRVPLSIRVPQASVERLVRQLGTRLDIAPVDAKWTLRKLRAVPTASRVGRRLNRVLTTRAIVNALRSNARTPIQLPFRVLQPKVSEDTIGRAIVIRRGQNALFLYDGTRTLRRFGVATGRSMYPTPLGHFEIITMQRNPWWYPPVGSAWAAGEEPVPPGPGNPLGTRWMGISSPNVGIHGTPDAASIGYSASHGCIRMRIPDAEWLFDHVDVGTQVFIVAA